MPPILSIDDLDTALDGHTLGLTALVGALTPVVHARVVRVLTQRGRVARGRDLRQEVEDLVQDVLCVLFADRGKKLRTWDPARGMSLLNYVGLIAEREVGHILLSSRRSPWTHEPTDAPELTRAAGSVQSAEPAVAAAQLFDRVWERLEEELSPKGITLFRALFVEERTVEQVSTDAGILPSAVYVWRNRLLKRARDILHDLKHP